jgi:hypothetical protein
MKTLNKKTQTFIYVSEGIHVEWHGGLEQAAPFTVRRTPDFSNNSKSNRKRLRDLPLSKGSQSSHVTVLVRLCSENPEYSEL